MPLIRLISFMLLSAYSLPTIAQEFNIGIHANPTLNYPILEGKSAYHTDLSVRRFNIDFSGGLNLQFRTGKFFLELAPTIVSKHIRFGQKTKGYGYQTIDSSLYVDVDYTLTAGSYSYELPLSTGYLLHHHEAATTYDLYGVIGASYEMNTTRGYNYSSSGVAVGNFTNFRTEPATTYPDAGLQQEWFNAIIGFKINAILRKVGLIEYGLSYHFPLQSAGRHTVSTIITNNQYASVYSGDFYPRLSYIDIKLCYYFLNFKKNEGVKHYRL